MKERLIALRPYLVKGVGYPAFFMFWFMVFVYVTFPYDRLRESIVAAAEAPRRGPTGLAQPSNVQLTIGDLGPTFFPGLRARNVTVTFLPTRASETAVTMRMQTLTVHASIFSLIAGSLNADLAIEGMGGTVEAHVEQALRGAHPGLRDFHATLDHIRAGDLAPLVAMVGLPLSGSVNGTIELNVPEGRFEQAGGSVRLHIDDFRIGDGHAQYSIPHFGGITIEQIRAGPLDAQITIRDGRATIDRFASRSDEFQLAMNGRVDLRPVFGLSDMDAYVRFQLTDVYRRKSEQAGRIMSVMDMIPDLQRARGTGGLLGFHCSGVLDRLMCPPDASGGATRGAIRRRGSEGP
jgi:type II secretion system protein N